MHGNKSVRSNGATMRKALLGLTLMALLAACGTWQRTGSASVACSALEREARADAIEALASGDPARVQAADVKIAGWKAGCGR